MYAREKCALPNHFQHAKTKMVMSRQSCDNISANGYYLQPIKHPAWVLDIIDLCKGWRATKQLAIMAATLGSP